MNRILKARCTVLFFGAQLVAASVAVTSHAADECASLTPEQTARKQALFKKIHAYDGCDQTLDKCTAMKNPHFSVRHTASDVCRMIKAKKSDDEIELAVSKRAQSLMPPLVKPTIRADSRTLAGSPDAKVSVTIYACARCPFCKVLVPRLYREVTQGSLKGKVNIQFRPFPIKSHEGALEGGLAMEAAASLGKFWPFVNLMYSRYDQFCPKLLSGWAGEAGVDKALFEKTLNDPKTRKAVVSSKQEGIVNKVTATPTLFIDDRQYVYDMSEGVLEDVLEEAYKAASSR